MRKKATILLTTVLAISLLSACGGSKTSGDAGGVGSSGVSEGSESKDTGKGKETKSGKDEITWSWGTIRGLYGDAEVTFNEDGGRETILMKYPNGRVYRQIEYSYDSGYVGNVDVDVKESFLSDRKVYPVSKITKNEMGQELYSYGYEWANCEMDIDYWGARGASDITPILEANELIDAGKTPEEPEERYYSCYEYGYNFDKNESSGYTNYQELSHLMVGGKYQDVYQNGDGYWLTKRVNGNPSKTWFYAADGRLDEELTITWKYEKDKPVSLQLGQYKANTYVAEVSDNGRTVTYTLDESHTAEGEAKDGEKAEKKDLEQIYMFTLTWQEDGKPAQFQYSSSKEFLNTDSARTQSYTITYHHENGVLTGSEYQINTDGNEHDPYTLTCNAEGMLETENHLTRSLSKEEIGAKAYTYYDNGAVKSVTYYGDFAADDPAKIKYMETYSEDGWQCGRALYKKGEISEEYTYHENGKLSGGTYYRDGAVSTAYTYNEKGVYTMYKAYREDGSLRLSGEMTGENEFTVYGYREDENNIQFLMRSYTYGEDEFEETVYKDDGSVDYKKTYEYKDGKNLSIAF